MSGIRLLHRMSMFAGLACLSFSLYGLEVSQAEWRAVTVKDKGSDRHHREAEVKDSQGNSLVIFRQPSGSVWIGFRLSGSRTYSSSKLPKYRIDDYQERDLEEAQRGQKILPTVHSFDWQPNQISLLIWHGLKEEGLSPTLIQLLEGKSVYFEYYVRDGGLRKAWFPLEGAAPVIASVLAIDPKVDNVTWEQLQQQRMVEMEASLMCRNQITRRDAFHACVDRIKECAQFAKHDLDRLRYCLEFSD